MKKSLLLLGIIALLVAGCGPDASNKTDDVTAVVEAWGPKSMVLGQTAKRQKDGSLGIWFKLSETVQSNEIEAWVGGQKMSKIRISERSGALAVESRLLDKPGKLPIYLVHLPSGKQIPLGDFEVRPSFDAAPEISITAWGPQSTFAGDGFNVQKNGVSAMWFKMSGAVAPGTMEAWFGNRKLEKFSVVSDKGGAMQIPQELFAKEGEYPVYLVHKPSKKRYELGKFLVK